MSFSWSTSSLSQIRRVVPRDEPAVKLNKSARQNVRDNKQL